MFLRGYIIPFPCKVLGMILDEGGAAVKTEGFFFRESSNAKFEESWIFEAVSAALWKKDKLINKMQLSSINFQ